MEDPVMVTIKIKMPFIFRLFKMVIKRKNVWFFLVIIINIAIIICYMLFNTKYNYQDKSFHYDHNETKYSIVIYSRAYDTKMFLFSFKIINNKIFLHKEHHWSITVGISIFMENTHKIEVVIFKHFGAVPKILPKTYWHKTPVIYKCDDILEKFSQRKLKKFFNAAKEYFKRIGFIIENNFISILKENEISLFSWVATNVLLERSLTSSRSITYVEVNNEVTNIIFSVPPNAFSKNNIYNLTISKEIMYVYMHTFINLGMLRARKEILIKYNQGNGSYIINSCVNPIIKNKTFTYDGRTYYVSGLKSHYPFRNLIIRSLNISQEIPIVEFSTCLQKFEDFIMTCGYFPNKLLVKQIFAFGYYFDRAVENGLIDEMTGGRLKIDNLEFFTKIVCRQPNTDQPFMCMDLVFLLALMRKLFGIDNNYQLYLYRKILNHDLSWILGQAYSILI